MLPSLAICPSLCALPVLAADRDEVIALIQTVSELSRQLRSTREVNLFRLDNASEILTEAKQFPVTPGIKALLCQHGLESIFSVNDIRLAINALIDRPKPISMLSMVSFVVPNVIAIRPKCKVISGPLFDGFALLLAHVAIAVESKQSPKELLAVTSVIPMMAEGIVEFEGRLELIDPPAQVGNDSRDLIDVHM
jgi:hypothetical protein